MSPSSDARERERLPDGHLSPRQMALYLEQGLPPAELLAVDDHLAVCPSCRVILAERLPAELALAALRDALAGDAGERPPAAGRAPARARRAWAPAWLASAGRRERWLALAAAGAVAMGILLAGRQAPPPRPDGTPTPEAPPPAALPPAGAPPRAVVFDGERRVELGADGTLRGLAGIPTVWQAKVGAALAAGRFDLPPAVRALGGPSASLRGGSPEPEAPAPLAPLGTAVASDRPEFRFRPLAGAFAHRVQVFDERYREVAASEPLAGTAWTPSAPLPRGVVLSWQVAASLDGREVKGPAPPAPEARFRILGREELEGLGAALEAASGSRLASAAIRAVAGLLEEAEEDLAALAAANPDSALLASLLWSLRPSQGPISPAPSPTSTKPAQ